MAPSTASPDSLVGLDETEIRSFMLYIVCGLGTLLVFQIVACVICKCRINKKRQAMKTRRKDTRTQQQKRTGQTGSSKVQPVAEQGDASTTPQTNVPKPSSRKK